MDDPLSAVDAHVGKYSSLFSSVHSFTSSQFSRHIFNAAIKKMLKDKLVVLITNNLQFLPDSDLIVYLDEGKIIGQGSFKQLVATNDRFKSLMDEFGIRKQKVDKKEVASNLTVLSTAEDKTGQQYQAEEKEIGAVSGRIYLCVVVVVVVVAASGPTHCCPRYYIKRAGVFVTVMACTLLCINAAAQLMSQWWLQFWPKDYIVRYNTTEAREPPFCAFCFRPPVTDEPI